MLEAANPAAPAAYLAWRYLPRDHPAYVEGIAKRGERGDPYSYTRHHEKAKPLTYRQTRRFLAYMVQVGTHGNFVRID